MPVPHATSFCLEWGTSTWNGATHITFKMGLPVSIETVLKTVFITNKIHPVVFFLGNYATTYRQIDTKINQCIVSSQCQPGIE